MVVERVGRREWKYMELNGVLKVMQVDFHRIFVSVGYVLQKKILTNRS